MYIVLEDIKRNLFSYVMKSCEEIAAVQAFGVSPSGTHRIITVD